MPVSRRSKVAIRGVFTMPEIDPEIIDLANAYLAQSPTSRAAKAIRLILDQGSATTRDLNLLGYDHPPRAIGDVKDLGFPILKVMIRSSDGKRMASYRFGSAADVRAGQIGRTNFSKAFKDALLGRYGPNDCITGVKHPARLLQIDHRIPYRVGGDAGFETNDVSAFMLLDAKSQRTKSWSCEQCPNFRQLNDANICRRCFWAFPEDYDHVAMKAERRCDVVWQDGEVADYDRLVVQATQESLSVPELLKRLGREQVLPRLK
jgi:hypothetical protein